MLYDLYPGFLSTVQYKAYIMVGVELTIANKNLECGYMPQYAISCLYVIIPYILAHFGLSSCSPSIVDLTLSVLTL
jgi:hypothetical protein